MTFLHPFHIGNPGRCEVPRKGLHSVMDYETRARAILTESLRAVPHCSRGVAIDVGVGIGNLYCVDFARLGYRTFAVEPLPNEFLRETCRTNAITLVEACLTDRDGTVELFLGTYKGQEFLNVSSIYQEWWGSSTESRVVRSMRLASLIETYGIKKISCLKIDTEGSEFLIISNLSSLSPGLLPALVQFEYGGGASKVERKGGWSKRFFEMTMGNLACLRELGYKVGVLVESTLPSEVLFSLQQQNFEMLFPDCCEVGNIIVSMDYELKQLGAVVRRARWREKLSQDYLEQLKNSFRNQARRLKHQLLR